MSKLRLARAAIAACAFGIVPMITNAAPVTLGFEGVVADYGQALPAAPYTEAGYQLVNLSPGPFSDGIFGKHASNSNGSATFVFCAYDSSCASGTAMKLTGPQPFTLTSIDVGNWELGGVAGTLELIGTLLGGATVSTVLGSADAWSTQTLSGFVNLTSVEFRGHSAYAVGIDNLVLDTSRSVPEPGSLALASLALAGLGLRGRKRVR